MSGLFGALSVQGGVSVADGCGTSRVMPQRVRTAFGGVWGGVVPADGADIDSGGDGEGTVEAC